MKTQLLSILLFFLFISCEKKEDLSYLKDIEIIAHRGVTSQVPENGLRAISKTIDLRLDAVEFDVQMSKDSIPVVFHDDDLTTMTGKIGKVSDYTLQELKQLRLRDKAGFITSDSIPTLREVLSFVEGRIHCFVDLKYSSLVMEKRVLELLEEYNMVDNVTILSFDNKSLYRLFILNNQLSLCLLLYDEASFPLNKDIDTYSHLVAFGVHRNLCRDGILIKLKADFPSFHIYAYTINSFNDITTKNLKRITGLITDNPVEWLSLKAANP